MDANNTRFHLISGREDWRKVQVASPASAAWDSGLQSMTLAPEMSLFPRGRRSTLLDPGERRGAASDRFGSWYWIGQDRRTLYRSPSGTVRATLYWQQASSEDRSAHGDFSLKTNPIASDLAGLAITIDHYLVVGILDQPGLLIFDLHTGGDPMRLEFPPNQSFEPFDITAAAGGGVWVLDRANRRLWGLDRQFRLLPLTVVPPAPLPPGSFSPADSAEPSFTPPTLPSPQGLPLPALDPIAVETLSDDSLLVLDQPAAFGESSRVFHYRLDTSPGLLIPPTAPLTLPDLSGVVVEGAEHPVEAYDMAYLPEASQLWVVEKAGNQSIAYHVRLPEAPLTELSLEPLVIYLPMHFFGKRALASASDQTGTHAIFYDVTPFPEKDLSISWLRLQSIDQQRYKRQALLEAPIFDSHQRGSVWHRLFLDACIPPETRVQVWSRANDDEKLILAQSYQPEPDVYLRGLGSEIPYLVGDEFSSGEIEKKEYVGTWETLFQSASGRFLQVRLVLTGNGRATPAIRRLRAYYPRFSYVRNYLPAAFGEEPASGRFLERMLANMEGFYTDLEGKIAHSQVLFDSQTAPPDTLDWLATWIGLVLDPLWSKVSREDRRRLMIRFARRLYERRGTADGIRFAILLFLDPCLELTLKRLEQAAFVVDLPLRRELERLDLPYPTPGTGKAELEELLFRLVLAAPGRSQVRIVEHWQTRFGMALQAGDPTLGAQEETWQSLEDAIKDSAHRFSVLIPENLPYEEFAMVEKIARLEKPAHTQMDIRRFWDYFLVGQARLQLDTILGEEGRFLPIILGRHYLSEGYLENARPMDITERTVSDRDHLGEMRL